MLPLPGVTSVPEAFTDPLGVRPPGSEGFMPRRVTTREANGKEAATDRRAGIFGARASRRSRVQPCQRDCAVTAPCLGQRSLPAALALSLCAFVCCGPQAVANTDTVVALADEGATENTTITDPSDDAALRGLTIEDANSNAISLMPSFASSTTLYWASVGPDVDQITIAPETNDDDATFAILDDQESVLDDADESADGFQVDLHEGANTIKVRVTAEDGTSTATYRVVVTRRVNVVSTLVSNAGQRLCTDPPNRLSQPFTTGDNAAGYTVTTVNVGISSATSAYLVRLVPSASDGRPDESDPSKFVTLTNPDQVATGVLNPFTAPAGTTLAASTTYHVMVTDTSGTGSAGRVKVTASPAEDSGGAAGWMIGDTSYHKTIGATHWDASSTLYLWMAVQGYANVVADTSTPSKLRSSITSPNTPEANLLAGSQDDTGGPYPAKPPSAPRGLTATPGDAQATFAWTAPLCDGSAAIRRYEYSVDDGTTWTDNGLDTQVTLTGLTRGTSIAFRVRAVNSAGKGSEASVTTTLPGGTDDGGGDGSGGGSDGGGGDGTASPPAVEREIGPQTACRGRRRGIGHLPFVFPAHHRLQGGVIEPVNRDGGGHPPSSDQSHRARPRGHCGYRDRCQPSRADGLTDIRRLGHRRVARAALSGGSRFAGSGRVLADCEPCRPAG